MITGGAGFVGSHLGERLLGEGNRVIVLDNLSTGKTSNISFAENDPRFDLVVGDVTDAPLVERLTSFAETVFHLAAAVGVKLILADAIGSLKTNVAGAETVLEACTRQRTKALIASTSEVYGKVARIPQREDDDVLLGPTCYGRWSYAASKMLDEFIGLAYHRQGLPVVIFRLFNTVGPRQSGRYGMVLPRFVSAALKGEAVPVYGDGTQSRCFLHVRDAVEALVRLERSPKAVGEVFNVGSTEPVTIAELARRVLAAVDSRVSGRRVGTAAASPAEARIRYVPYGEAYPSGGFEEIGHRMPDITKIRGVTRWRPKRSLGEILEDVVDERSLALEELREQVPVAALA
ncbi:MAG TPA: NAD-dependent epimerase/dehydratase family protein [Gaiellaceae bacterium]|nr:NAD-dependent epimerase/dehydratase family protein [Gaiellaceae bacterium]